MRVDMFLQIRILRTSDITNISIAIEDELSIGHGGQNVDVHPKHHCHEAENHTPAFLCSAVQKRGVSCSLPAACTTTHPPAGRPG